MDLSKIKIAGGWAMERERFSEAARRLLATHINSFRDIMSNRLPDSAEAGTRFSDDAGILARLESRFTEGEFMKCPGPCINAALLDAAQSDYYYTHEKDYDWPDVPEIDEVEDDE